MHPQPHTREHFTCWPWAARAVGYVLMKKPLALATACKGKRGSACQLGLHGCTAPARHGMCCQKLPYDA